MQPDQDIRTEDRLDFDLMDNKLLQKYLLELKSQRLEFEAVPDDEILERMSLRRDNRPTLAAVMSFSSCPQAYFPQWCVTAVVIPGKKMGETCDEYRFLDNRRIEGPISEMVAGAVCFVGRNKHKAMRFTEDVKRVDVPEFPLKTVREVVFNALVHRDYSPYTEGSV
ncbi:MAG: hypothetical protein LUD51_06980 [Clostridia bacterium]|nr:hypothetical protein [Clostridia bacterium]